MQKIETLFERDASNPKFVTRTVRPECQWVIDGDGVATAKWDGTACLIRGGVLYRRHQLKAGRTMPAGWIHWTFEPGQDSGHGWIPVGDSPADDYHREAWGRLASAEIIDGTYELCGPKVNGDPHSFGRHELVPHGQPEAPSAPRDFDELSTWLASYPFEGLVWHHPDGRRMAKIKRRDFGLPWPAKGGA